jgi:DNA-binding transcriptional regulator YiaG
VIDRILIRLRGEIMFRPDDEAKIAAGYEKFAETLNGYNGKGSARMRLRAARATLDMTQKEFAEKFGVSVDTVKSWESNSRPEPHGIARLLIEMIGDDPIRASNIAVRLSSEDSAEKNSEISSKKMEHL